ncbi:MAG: hypothetical protein WB588_02120 [Dehalococcoidia bacterium]
MVSVYRYPLPGHIDNAANQCKEQQCAADVEDYVGIGELIYLEGAGRYAAR